LSSRREAGDCSTTGENPKWWGTDLMFSPSTARMWGEHRLPTPFSLPQWGDLGNVTELGTITEAGRGQRPQVGATSAKEARG